jgi:5-methylcytosine-specific restriction endonuclease McrA
MIMSKQEGICRECGQEKPLEDFYLDPKTKGKHRTKCKACWQKASASRRKANQLRGKIPILLESEKICRKCKQQKPVTEFYIELSESDGFRDQCKDCCKKATAARREVYRQRGKIAVPLGYEKLCRGCGQIKPISEFSAEPSSGDGYRNKCKDCVKKMVKEWEKKNPEKARARQKKHAAVRKQRDPEKERKRHREYAAAWRKRNPAKQKEIEGRSRAKQRENLGLPPIIKRSKGKTQEGGKQRGRKQKSRKQTEWLTYLIRLLSAEGKTSLTQIQARIDFYGGKCYLCGEPFRTLDHVKPLSKGGTNWSANLRPICKKCNMRKSNHWPYPPVFARKAIPLPLP